MDELKLIFLRHTTMRLQQQKRVLGDNHSVLNFSWKWRRNWLTKLRGKLLKNLIDWSVT